MVGWEYVCSPLGRDWIKDVGREDGEDDGGGLAKGRVAEANDCDQSLSDSAALVNPGWTFGCTGDAGEGYVAVDGGMPGCCGRIELIWDDDTPIGIGGRIFSPVTGECGMRL